MKEKEIEENNVQNQSNRFNVCKVEATIRYRPRCERGKEKVTAGRRKSSRSRFRVAVCRCI